MVQQRFIQTFISVNVVEECSKAEERASGHSSEHKPIPREEPIPWDNSLVRFALSNHSSVHVNEEVEHEAVNDWVNFEVNTQAVEEACKHVLSFEDEVHWDEHKHWYDVIIRASSAHGDD